MFSSFSWMDAMTTSPIVLVLVICSVVTLGAAIERIYYYSNGGKIPTRRSVKQWFGSVRAGSTTRRSPARRACTPSVLSGSKCSAASDKSADAFEERLHVALSGTEAPPRKKLERTWDDGRGRATHRTFGTVWGIMRAFSDMAQTGSAAPSVVAAGVAEALVTTAAGLVVAVPALILYNHLSRRMNVMLTVAENHSRTLRTVILEEIERREKAAKETVALEKARISRDEARSQAAAETPQPEPSLTR